MSSEKSCYLILHLIVPDEEDAKNYRRHLSTLKDAGKKMKINIWPIAFKNSHIRRYTFRFLRYRRDDSTALKIAESFISAFSLVHGPAIEPNPDGIVFRYPNHLIDHEGTISFDDLLELEKSRPRQQRTCAYPGSSLGSGLSTVLSDFEQAWRITPVIFENEHIFQASRFFRASRDLFYVHNGALNEVLKSPELTAKSGFEQIRFENALQNAYKSIEALLGDLPKNNIRFFSKLREIGLNPYEEVGYDTTNHLHIVIREMNKARDKKAAHGSTKDRTIFVKELMNYQECAAFVLCEAIGSILGTDFLGNPMD